MDMPVHVIGPDRYCPYCERLLVRVKPDGAMDLSGHTQVHLEAAAKDQRNGVLVMEIVDAYCEECA